MLESLGTPGDLDRVMTCVWTSDEEEVVMEVQASILAQPCNSFAISNYDSIRELF